MIAALESHKTNFWLYFNSLTVCYSGKNKVTESKKQIKKSMPTNLAARCSNQNMFMR
jgi:hypothetical protein